MKHVNKIRGKVGQTACQLNIATGLVQFVEPMIAFEDLLHVLERKVHYVLTS